MPDCAHKPSWVPVACAELPERCWHALLACACSRLLLCWSGRRCWPCICFPVLRRLGRPWRWSLAVVWLVSCLCCAWLLWSWRWAHCFCATLLCCGAAGAAVVVRLLRLLLWSWQRSRCWLAWLPGWRQGPHCAAFSLLVLLPCWSWQRSRLLFLLLHLLILDLLLLIATCACWAKKQKTVSGEIFLTRNGTSLSRRQIWAELKQLCRRARVSPSKVFPHNLRHLFATTFYKACKDIVRLADVLGHSSIETTRLYLVTTGTEHIRLLEKLGLVL